MSHRGNFISVRTALVAAIALVAAVGCGPKNQFVAPPPPTVTVAKPVEREVADALTFTGWTQATGEVDLRSRVSGYLDKVFQHQLSLPPLLVPKVTSVITKTMMR